MEDAVEHRHGEHTVAGERRGHWFREDQIVSESENPSLVASRFGRQRNPSRREVGIVGAAQPDH